MTAGMAEREEMFIFEPITTSTPIYFILELRIYWEIPEKTEEVKNLMERTEKITISPFLSEPKFIN